MNIMRMLFLILSVSVIAGCDKCCRKTGPGGEITYYKAKTCQASDEEVPMSECN